MLRGAGVPFLDAADPLAELAGFLGGARPGQAFGEFLELLFEAPGLLGIDGLVFLGPRGRVAIEKNLAAGFVQDALDLYLDRKSVV